MKNIFFWCSEDLSSVRPDPTPNTQEGTPWWMSHTHLQWTTGLWCCLLQNMLEPSGKPRKGPRLDCVAGAYPSWSHDPCFPTGPRPAGAGTAGSLPKPELASLSKASTPLCCLPAVQTAKLVTERTWIWGVGKITSYALGEFMSSVWTKGPLLANRAEGQPLPWQRYSCPWIESVGQEGPPLVCLGFSYVHPKKTTWIPCLRGYISQRNFYSTALEK